MWMCVCVQLLLSVLSLVDVQIDVSDFFPLPGIEPGPEQ